MSIRLVWRLPRSRRCAVCGKVRYATREAAAVVLAKASARRREVRAYYSGPCGGWWHLTSQQRGAKPMAGATSGSGRPS